MIGKLFPLVTHKVLEL